MKGFLAALVAIPAALTNAAATGLQFQQANVSPFHLANIHFLSRCC